MRPFYLGESVTTPLGRGEIMGFERFDRQGNSTTPSDDDNGVQRVIVKLDDSTRWAPTKLTPHPYFGRHELVSDEPPSEFP